MFTSLSTIGFNSIKTRLVAFFLLFGVVPAVCLIAVYFSFKGAIEDAFRAPVSALAINENTVMRSVLEAPGVLDERVGRLMEAPLPIVQAEDPVREIISILARKSASSVLVMENNQAAGIITRTDVIGFVSL